MTHIARILKSREWANVSGELTLASSPQLIYDLCAAKGSGTSFWAVNYVDISSLARMSAAMTNVTREVGVQRFGVIAISEVQNLRIEITSSKGTEVVDEEFRDNNHRDLKIKNLRQAFKITQKIHPNIVTLPTAEVKKYFKAAIDAQWFKIEKLNPDFQKKLAIDGFFKLSY